MHWALGHLVLFCFALAVAWIGYQMSRHPEKTSSIFLFDQPPNRFSIGFFRILGRAFLVAFALGAVMYLILIPLDLLGLNLGH